MTFALPRNHGCRISDDWSFKGMRTIVIENDFLRVVVLVDRGSDIVEFRYKPMDLDFLLFAAGGVRNPHHQIPPAATDAPYLDYFGGGWNEILPNGGPGVRYRGADLGQHGEISLIPWDHVITEDTPERVSVRLGVRPIRTPFLVTKTLTMNAGRPALHISETVTNESGEAIEFMWGHHIAFGRPFLEEGAIIDAPARVIEAQGVWPGYEPRRFRPSATGTWPLIPSSGKDPVDASRVPPFGKEQGQEMAYLKDLSEGWYAITNPVRKVGFGLSFDASVFQFIWYWQQLGNVASGYPWWKRLHTQALEAWSSYPSDGLTKAIENGTALILEPGRSIDASLVAVAYEGAPGITAITPDGDVLR